MAARENMRIIKRTVSTAIRRPDGSLFINVPRKGDFGAVRLMKSGLFVQSR
jgi:hypothetical protein